MAEQNNNQNQVQDVNQLLKVRREKLTNLQEAGKDPYVITTYDVTDHSGEILADFAAYEGKEVSIAGRMMSRRVMGKASFAHLLDRDGRIQIYVKRDDVGEDEYKQFKEASERMHQLEEEARALLTKLPEEFPLPPPEVELTGMPMNSPMSVNTMEMVESSLMRILME